MIYRVATAAGTYPITTAEAKAQCRVEHTVDDDLIGVYIAAATEDAEALTGRVFISSTLEAYLDRWPKGRVIDLPAPPLIGVTSVEYYADGESTLTTLDSAKYVVDTISEPGRIQLDEDEDWPDLENRINAVKITYTAGWVDAASVPQSVKQALLMAVGHWYEQRSAVNVGNISTEVPMTTRHLLAKHKAFSEWTLINF